MRMDIPWAEHQHLNYLLRIIAAVGEDEEDNKPRKLTHEELMSFVKWD